MSTNSTIRIKRADGTVTGIYCHHDGYVEFVGVTLQLAYDTADKVEKLLALGDLSTLGYYTEPKEGTPHDFENPQRDVCVAYHRDRGEDFSQSNGNCEFIYTFDEREAVWYVEHEVPVNDTPAQDYLCLDTYYRYEKRLLLDALLECDFDNGWQADDFVQEGKDFVAVCSQKAKAARQAIIDKEREDYEAYYRAYCD